MRRSEIHEAIGALHQKNPFYLNTTACALALIFMLACPFLSHDKKMKALELLDWEPV
jgi:hypothetical protein